MNKLQDAQADLESARSAYRLARNRVIATEAGLMQALRNWSWGPDHIDATTNGARPFWRKVCRDIIRDLRRQRRELQHVQDWVSIAHAQYQTALKIWRRSLVRTATITTAATPALAA